MPSATTRVDEAAGADRVVVPRDDVVGVVRVAVRVDEADDRDPQPARLANAPAAPCAGRHEDGVGEPLHVGHAAEVDLELLELGRASRCAPSREQLELALVAEAAQLVQALDALRDRAPVGEQAAEPAVVHVGHPDAGRLARDRVLRLLLRADEQDGAATLGDVAHELRAPARAAPGSAAGR